MGIETGLSFTWTEVQQCLFKLFVQIKEATLGDPEKRVFNSFPLIIYGLPRGGQLTALLLDYAFSGHFMMLENAHDAMEMSHYLGNNMLIIDDIADTGKSLQPFVLSDCQTAVLIKRQSCKVEVNFVGTVVTHEDYVLFPWEKSPEQDRRIWLERKAYESKGTLSKDGQSLCPTHGDNYVKDCPVCEQYGFREKNIK